LNILAIDTSTKSGSIALSEDDKVLGETSLNINITHSETLLFSLQHLLGQCSISMDDIDLFALTIGPGSFTGVRIGVSTVKGFALATGKPVTGISTLEAMAWNFPYSSVPVVPFLDARRGEVYSASFAWDKGTFKRLHDDRTESPEEVLSSIKGEALLVGDGVEKYKDLVRTRFGSRALVVPSSHASVRASIVASLAYDKYLTGEVLDLNSFIPIYLRKSEAEINREKELLKKG